MFLKIFRNVLCSSHNSGLVHGFTIMWYQLSLGMSLVTASYII